MKLKHLVLSALALSSLSASALEVVSAKLDSSAENLVVTVRHGGGCGQHNYKLEISGCLESMPVRCQATIKHITSDFCEAYLTREAKFNLNEYGLNDPYYKNASITIKGDGNTTATTTLASAESDSSGKVRCLTHTGSVLEISNKTVMLTTADNETADYNVVSKNIKVVETYPSILVSTYKLDDGRLVVTKFQSKAKTGQGYFIRNDGTTSPTFSCVSN